MHLYICMDMSIDFGSKMVLSTPMWSNLVRFGGHFWSIFGPFWDHFGSFGRVSRDTYKKLPKKLKRTPPKLHLEASWSSSWSYLERRWRPRAPRWANMTAKMAILGSTWRLLGRFGEHFGAIWANRLSIEKHWKTSGFYCFFRIGGSRRAVLEQLGSMLGHSRRHLGATWPENGSQERQDEPKNRNCAFHHVFLRPRCTDCDRGRWKWTPGRESTSSGGAVAQVFP